MQKEIKYRGISRAMSDMGVTDGGLAECANLVLDRGEIVPIVPPKVLADLPDDISYDLLYIHKSPGFTGPHYIALYYGSIYYVGDDFAVNMLGTGNTLDTGETIRDVKAVGNTIIVATSLRMRYFLWTTNTVSAGAYKYLGSKIPSIELKASTEYVDPVPRRPEALPTVTTNFVDIVAGALGVSSDKAKVILGTCFENANHQTITYPDEEAYSPIQAAYISENVIHVGNQDEGDIEEKYYVDEIMSVISRAIWSSLASAIGSAHSNSLLEQPVLLRCAIRLFDGSYINHTVPILLGAETYTSLIQSASANYRQRPLSTDWLSWIHNNVISLIGDSNHVSYPESISTSFCKEYKIYLQFMNTAAIAEWSDVVKGIDIFLSEPAYLTKYGARIRQIDKTTTSGTNNGVSTTYTTCSVSFEAMTGDEKNDALIAKSNFYRVSQIDIENVTDAQFQLENLSNKLGDKLLTMPSLPDDYRSNHEVWPEKMFEMNNRLNILNIHTRYFQGPAYPASTIPAISNKAVAVKYHIRGEAGKEIVTYRNHGTNLPGAWLVYPDARCYAVDVYITDTSSSTTITKVTLPMKEHPLLNCAYSFLGFGISDLSGYAGVSVEAVSTITQLLDHAYNKIFQSAVDNPFFFPPAGRHSVAGGSIIGVASTTKALSQGQFGQFPLYVFCTEGIWAMEADAAGEYLSIKPVCRVVCNNANSITGIDGAVVFSTERGVMLIAGAEVQNLSENMIGKHFRADSLAALEEIAASHYGSTLPGDVSDDLSFVDYIAGCFIGYDFANARLICVNPSCEYQYVYSIGDATWHKMCFGLTFKKALNSYPDLYMQCDSNEGDAVYNFSIQDDVNDFTTRTFGILVTRALDFDEPYVLKTIQAIRHRGDYDKDYVSFLLYGSRDGINYIPVHSLKGKSFKFYRIAIMAKLLPTEHIARSTVEFTDKFTNKLR